MISRGRLLGLSERMSFRRWPSIVTEDILGLQGLQTAKSRVLEESRALLQLSLYDILQNVSFGLH